MEAKDSIIGIPPALLDGREDQITWKLTLEEEEVPLDIEEDVVEEMIRWLEREISGARAAPSPGPGGGESCGASFSDSASTVMASVDTRGEIGSATAPFFWPTQPPPASSSSGCGSPEGSGGGGLWEIMRRVEGKEVEWDGDGDEEEWLARVFDGTEMELEASDADGFFLL